MVKTTPTNGWLDPGALGSGTPTATPPETSKVQRRRSPITSTVAASVAPRTWCSSASDSGASTTKRCVQAQGAGVGHHENERGPSK